MKKKVIVLSLGGSQIIPKDINIKFLKKFKKILKKNSRKYKFVVVCGGGSTAREYIQGISKERLIHKRINQDFLGIAATRLNARFMTYFFGEGVNKEMPADMGDVKNMLRLHDIVFCGALRYAKDETSDGASAKLANFFESSFINITNVQGLYNKNPKKFKKAKFISKITWEKFHKMATAQKFHPGQHFVLDQSASKIIKKNKIPTYIIGSSLKQLDKILKNKKFKGTLIQG
jgi:uridylate kinase